jgi:hypothetical protein
VLTIIDRGGVGDMLKGVRELEDKVGGFRKVRELGGHSRLAAPCIADL